MRYNVYENEMDGNNVILSEAILSLYVPVNNKKDHSAIVINAESKEGALDTFFNKYGISDEDKHLYFVAEA